MSSQTPETTTLEEVIDRLRFDMTNTGSETEEYATQVKHLEQLYKMQALSKPDSVSRDTIATIAGHLAGIVLILQYERLHPISSKAVGFLKMLR